MRATLPIEVLKYFMNDESAARSKTFPGIDPSQYPTEYLMRLRAGERDEGASGVTRRSMFRDTEPKRPAFNDAQFRR